MQWQIDGKIVAGDKEGYLLNKDEWSEALAEIIAKYEGIELNEAHWEVIHFVRNFYSEYQTSPAIRILVKAMAEKFGPEKAIVDIYNDYFQMVLRSKRAY